MKTKRYFGFIATAAAVMVLSGGCAKEITSVQSPEKDPVQGPEKEVTVITAETDHVTKTYLGNPVDNKRKVFWEDGDKIGINGVESVELSNIAPDTQRTAFTFEEALSAPYNAVYPSSIYKDPVTVTLPSVQDFREGTLAQNAIAMAAYAESDGLLSFRHLSSVLKISLNPTAGAEEIDYIEFRGNNGEQVAGDFTINYETATLSASESYSGGKAVRINVGKAVREIYMAVPAGKYEKGFSIKIVDGKGHYMKAEKDDESVFKAGYVAIMPEIVFSPAEGDGTGTEENPWKIGTVEKWEEIVADLNSAVPTQYMRGDYYVLTDDIDFTGRDFTPITTFGVEPADGAVNPNAGVLDGQGHKLTGIVAKGSVNRFGIICTNAGTIRNIIVENADISSSGNACGFVGRNYAGGIIDGVSFSGTVSGSYRVGGVCGQNNGDALIKNSSFLSGTVKSTSREASGTHINDSSAGGVCGINDGRIENSTFVSGTVEGIQSSAGICGKNCTDRVISGSKFLSGTIKGETNLGCVCGLNEGELIDSEASEGNISGMNGVGGVCGVNGWSNSNAKILRASSSSCKVTASTISVGGIVGINRRGTLEGAIFKSGTVKCDGDNAGGVCGLNNGLIDNSDILAGTVESGTSYAGGICGQSVGTIVNCEARGGDIRAEKYCVGGVVGWNLGFVVNCLSWANSVKSNTKYSVGGVCGEIPTPSETAKSEKAAIINCYSACTDITFAAGYNANTAGSVVGKTSVRGIQNVYGPVTDAIPYVVGNNNSTFSAGVFSDIDWGTVVTEGQMKGNGKVTVASSGKECGNFVEALNEGVSVYNAWESADKPAGITLKAWTASDTYPVLAE